MAGTRQKAAEDYLTLSQGMQDEDGLKLLEKMKPLQGKVILDLGCGTGRLSSIIAETVGPDSRVTGVDPDFERLELAKKTFGHVTNLAFAEGSSNRFAHMEEHCYDIVFLVYVLQWVEDKRAAFNNIYRSLKPGGRVAIIYETEVTPLFQKVVRELNPDETYNRFLGMLFCEPRELIEQYCREAGFAITESLESTRCALHKDLPHYLSFASAMSHGLFNLDLIDKERLKTFKLPYSEDGRVEDSFCMCTLIATKKG